MRDYAPMYAANVDGTRNVLERGQGRLPEDCLHKHGWLHRLAEKCERKVHADDEQNLATEAQMTNHYKRSKWQAEQVALELSRKDCPLSS